MIRFTAPFFVVALASLPALADSHSGTKAAIDILPGWRAESGTHIAALRMTLEPGWKTYWRAPGEAGLPPVFDWSGSANLDGVDLHWPVPEVFDTNGMVTLGYHDELVLPIEVHPTDPGADVVLEGDFAFGICHEICMPMQAHVSAVLTGDAAGGDARIEAALASAPDTAQEAGVVTTKCAIAPIADGLRVTAKIDMPRIGAGERAILEGPSTDIWVSDAVTRRAENMLTVTADFVPPQAAPFELDTDDVRITLLSGTRAVEIEGCSYSY